RWNLAETYFGLSRYESSAQTYRWVARNWVSEVKTVPGTAISAQAADLKAIASRYEALKEAHVVPSELKASASALVLKDSAKTALVREWIQWIDENASNGGQALAGFGFEANRTLYSAGFQDEAMERMKTFVARFPTAKQSVASASLVVDTWIARVRWDHVEAEAAAFSKKSGWAKPTFGSEMGTQAAGAKYKRAESAFAAKKFDESATHATEFLASYGRSNLAVDANGIACNSFLNLGELAKAVDCFDGLAARFPKSPASVQALRTAARIEDDRMKFASASDHYLKYLDHVGRGLKADESLTIRKRVLLLARASGEASRMAAFASSKKLCAPKLQAECDLNLALASLTRSAAQSQDPHASLKNMSRSRRELRAIYALSALEQWKQLDGRTLDGALKTLGSEWKNTDASVRYFLIARATKTLPAILVRDRAAIAKTGMAANESAITKRMKLLASLEGRTGLIGSIPVTSLQAAALETVYLGYADLINDIRSIPVPEKAVASQKAEHLRLLTALTQPLVLKSRKIRDSFAILDLREKSGLDASNADQLFDAPAGKNASFDALRKEWSQAIHDENWSRVSFLSDEASEMKNLPANWSKAARAISLATAGAAAEAKIVFGDACRDSSGSASLRDTCRSVSNSTRAKGRG
ncbi:MAG: hypothetical protein H7301_11960, partial [Cryobacterium sp.]|nr:hypothetical protein [Oligoflexia bacterium]